jgi:integrase/recombinase XerD
MVVLHAAGSLDAFWALLNAWVDHMAARELTPETIEQRESYLLRFFRRTRTSPETVTENVCEKFLASVNPRSSTREAYVAALRSFYRFAHARGYVDADPAADLHARPPKYPPPDFFTVEEVRAIIAAAERRPPAMRRATIVLLFETGARIGSLAAVEPKDVRNGHIHFRQAKNDRAYDVVLTPAAKQAVRVLLALHRDSRTLIGRHPETIGEWFRDAARDAGLPEGRVNAHLARHTAATALYERTKDPLLVKDFLNHADLSQVHRYARVSETKMRDALGRSLTG